MRATSFTEAEDAIQARRAFGIVGIPPDTERNFLKGVQARLPIIRPRLPSATISPVGVTRFCSGGIGVSSAEGRTLAADER